MEGCASLQWPSSWDLGDDCRGGRHGDCCDGCGFAEGEDYILGETLAQVKDIHLYMIGIDRVSNHVCIMYI